MTTITKLSPEQANNLVQEDKGALIDVRTVGEALAEELPGSLFLPFDLVSREKLEELGVHNKTPIMVCRSGFRARQAAEALARHVEEVAILDGGIVAWKQKGLPFLTGKKTIPVDRQVLIGAGSMILAFTLLGLLISPLFHVLTMFMTGGMIFAGITGACGMARILVMLPWNKAPMCADSCKVMATEARQT